MSRSSWRELKTLPPQRLAEVEDFVDFLRSRGKGSPLGAGRREGGRSELRQGADNADDAEYDRL